MLRQHESSYQPLCSHHIMCALKQHAPQNYPVYYACMGSLFKSVLIGDAFVFVPYESSTSHLSRLLCVTALSLLLVVVIDPSKGNELCNSNLKVLQ